MLKILNELRDKIDPEETKTIQDLNYVIKKVGSGKLEEIEGDNETEGGGKKKTEAKSWVMSYTNKSRELDLNTE